MIEKEEIFKNTSRTFEEELKITFIKLQKKYKVPTELINKIWLLSGNYFKQKFILENLEKELKNIPCTKQELSKPRYKFTKEIQK